jgi:glucarate dehydratase
MAGIEGAKGDPALEVVGARRWMVRMPFHAPMEWASGSRPGATRLIVEIETRSGVKGYGETICLLDAIPAVLDKVVLPIAQRHAVDQAEGLHRHVLGAGYYHHKRAAVMALAAVEMAYWDAFGKACGQPLHRLWGGLWRSRIDLAGYILSAKPEAAAAAAARYRDDGYASFKVKIGMSEASDLALVEAVRREVGAAHLRADVNGAWTPGTARRQLAKLAPYDLAYVEQPLELDDLAGHAALRRAQAVPIALDESAYTLADVGNILRAEAADVVLLDPHEAGGCWQVVKQAGVCESVGLPVTLHSGGELGLSQAAYLHLAASIPNMTLAIDTERSHLVDDVIRTPFTVADGSLFVPTEPGLGVEPDFDKLERWRTSEIVGAYLDAARPGWFPVKPAY